MSGERNLLSASDLAADDARADEQLRSLYILSQEQINTFLKYRSETGSLLSVYELQTIFDEVTFQKIAPFVTVADASKSFNKNIFN